MTEAKFLCGWMELLNRHNPHPLIFCSKQYYCYSLYTSKINQKEVMLRTASMMQTYKWTNKEWKPIIHLSKRYNTAYSVISVVTNHNRHRNTYVVDMAEAVDTALDNKPLVLHNITICKLPANQQQLGMGLAIRVMHRRLGNQSLRFVKVHRCELCK